MDMRERHLAITMALQSAPFFAAGPLIMLLASGGEWERALALWIGLIVGYGLGFSHGEDSK